MERVKGEAQFGSTMIRDSERIVYTPRGMGREEKRGAFHVTRLMWHELLSSRELIWRLFVRDFSAKYRQSALGILWAVLMPLITVGIFIGMNRAGVLSIENIDTPYPLYAIIGLTLWNVFTVGLTACAGSLVNAGAMVAKINFPKTTLILASSGQGVVEFIIRMFLIAGVFLYFGMTPDWSGLIVALICVIPIYLLMTGMGFILSLVGGVLRDVINIVNLALMGIMLLTPVVYPIKGGGFLAQANLWNPFNYLVNVPRDFVIKGYSELLTGFFWASAFSILVFYLGWRLFYLAQTKIAERI